MKKQPTSAILGAAFLMATSAIGPGFLTQTTVFTEKIGASFGFVILLSIVLDIFAQLNIWRILCVRGQFAQAVANERLQYSGDVLSVLIVLGGLAFNIGNVAGAGLGLQTLFGISVQNGAILSAFFAIGVFLAKEMGETIDAFSKTLGILMFGLIIYVVFKAQPVVQEVIKETFMPSSFDALATITLVGGTVGGYITFAGAHRLVDAGVIGVENLPGINRGAIQGIVLTGLIRFLLFLAVFGVVSMGLQLDSSNPPGSVFQQAAGNIGFKLFGFLIWAAAITSVVGSAYTSVSFIKTMHPAIDRHQKGVIIGFIGFSTLIFYIIGKPVSVLVFVGYLNGLILPISLGIILLAANQKSLYNHPKWLSFAGWLVVILMSMLSIKTMFF